MKLLRQHEKDRHYVRTTNDSLKDHIAPHPLFGDLTAYQWLVMIPAHANRHVDQLDEVKAIEDFPFVVRRSWITSDVVHYFPYSRFR